MQLAMMRAKAEVEAQQKCRISASQEATEALRLQLEARDHRIAVLEKALEAAVPQEVPSQPCGVPSPAATASSELLKKLAARDAEMDSLHAGGSVETSFARQLVGDDAPAPITPQGDFSHSQGSLLRGALIPASWCNAASPFDRRSAVAASSSGAARAAAAAEEEEEEKEAVAAAEAEPQKEEEAACLAPVRCRRCWPGRSPTPATQAAAAPPGGRESCSARRSRSRSPARASQRPAWPWTGSCPRRPRLSSRPCPPSRESAHQPARPPERPSAWATAPPLGATSWPGPDPPRSLRLRRRPHSATLRRSCLGAAPFSR